MPNENLDYKQMFMVLTEKFGNKLREQESYFAILKEINELKPYNDLISTKIFDLKMYEQYAIFKHILEINKISKRLCEKYGWDKEIETGDE